MKKSIVAVLAMVPMAAFAAAPAKAAPVAHQSEISVGTIELKGDASLNLKGGSVKNEQGGQSVSNDTSSYGLGVTGAYYAAPVGPGLLGIGGVFKYNSDTTKGTNGASDVTSSSFLIGPAAVFDMPLAEKISGFGQVGLGYASNKEESGGQTVDGSGWFFGLGVGVKYFLTKNFSLDAALEYNYVKVSADLPGGGGTGKRTTTDYGIVGGLSVYFPTK